MRTLVLIISALTLLSLVTHDAHGGGGLYQKPFDNNQTWHVGTRNQGDPGDVCVSLPDVEKSGVWWCGHIIQAFRYGLKGGVTVHCVGNNEAKPPTLHGWNQGKVTVRYKCSGCTEGCDCVAYADFLQQVRARGDYDLDIPDNDDFKSLDASITYHLRKIDSEHDWWTWKVGTASHITSGWSCEFNFGLQTEADAKGPKVGASLGLGLTFGSSFTRSAAGDAGFMDPYGRDVTITKEIPCGDSTMVETVSEQEMWLILKTQDSFFNLQDRVKLDLNTSIHNYIVVYAGVFETCDPGDPVTPPSNPATVPTDYNDLGPETPVFDDGVRCDGPDLPMGGINDYRNKGDRESNPYLSSVDAAVVRAPHLGSSGIVRVANLCDDLSSDMTLSISCNPTGIVNVPATIVLPADELYCEFDVGAISLGPVTITIEAPDGGFDTVSLEIDDLPVETNLTLSQEAVSAIAGDGTPPIVVRRSRFLDFSTEDTVVSIVLDDPQGIIGSTPGSVTIEAGTSFETLSIPVIGPGTATVSFLYGQQTVALSVTGLEAAAYGILNPGTVEVVRHPGVMGVGIGVPTSHGFWSNQTVTCTVNSGTSVNFPECSFEFERIGAALTLPLEVLGTGVSSVTVSANGRSVTFDVSVVSP